MMKNRSMFSVRFRTSWPYLSGLVCLLFLGLLLWARESLMLPVAASALLLLVRVSSAAAATLAIADEERRSLRRTLSMMAVGIWVWAAGDATATLYGIATGQPLPEPSLADLLSLSGYLAMLAALVGYPTSPPERFSRLRSALDIALQLLAVFILSWLVFVRPIADVGFLRPDDIFWTAVRPILDGMLLVLGLRLTLLGADRAERRGLYAWDVGFLLMLGGDLFASLQRMTHGEQAAFAALGWMAAAILFGIGFFSGPRREKVPEPVNSRRSPARLLLRLEALGPIAMTYAVVGVTIADWRISGELDWFGVSGAALLVLLLFGRQGVIAGQQEMRQYAALVNATTDLGFIAGEDGVLHFLNPAMARVAGDLQGGAAGGRLHQMIHSDVPVDEILAQAAVHGWVGEVEVHPSNGDGFPALLALSPVADVSGERALLAGTAHDLTAIRERELRLREALQEVDRARGELAAMNVELEGKVEARTQDLKRMVADLERLNRELQELDKLKTDFVALVSHELRAPLTNIRSGIELVVETYPELEAEVRRALQTVRGETERLSRFVETILDLSALEAGGIRLHSESVNVGEIADRVLSRLAEPQIGRVQVTVKPKSLAVVADGEALASVCFQLLDNALKYAPEGPINLAAKKEQGRGVIAVCDQGPGIPEGERERVFEMFHRLDSRDDREVYGYGLGLAMARRLVELMEGEIEIAEGFGGGTCVRIHLPLAASGR